MGHNFLMGQPKIWAPLLTMVCLGLSYIFYNMTARIWATTFLMERPRAWATIFLMWRPKIWAPLFMKGQSGFGPHFLWYDGWSLGHHFFNGTAQVWAKIFLMGRPEFGPHFGDKAAQVLGHPIKKVMTQVLSCLMKKDCGPNSGRHIIKNVAQV